MAITTLFPLLMGLTEMIKRLIPKKHRKVATPLLTSGMGIGLAWAGGGHESGLGAIVEGLTASAAAIGAYKGPKEMGKIILGEK